MSRLSAKSLILENVRFNYLTIETPKAFNSGQRGKYSSMLLLDKADTATVHTVQQAIGEILSEIESKWEKDPSKVRTALRDGDIEKDGVGEYENHFYLNASNYDQPLIFDENNQDMRGQISKENPFYSGCYGKVKIQLYPYNVRGTVGIACKLDAVQRTRFGDKLGHRKMSERGPVGYGGWAQRDKMWRN